LRPLRCGLAQGGNSQLHQDSSLGCKALQLTKSNGQRTSPFGNIDHFYQFLIHYTSSLRILLFVTAGQLRQHVLLPSDTVLIDGFPEFFWLSNTSFFPAELLIRKHCSVCLSLHIFRFSYTCEGFFAKCSGETGVNLTTGLNGYKDGYVTLFLCNLVHHILHHHLNWLRKKTKQLISCGNARNLFITFLCQCKALSFSCTMVALDYSDLCPTKLTPKELYAWRKKCDARVWNIVEVFNWPCEPGSR
jgi:hypothetical protein